MEMQEEVVVKEEQRTVSIKVYEMDKTQAYKDIPFGVPLSALKDLVNLTIKSLESTQEKEGSVYYLRLEMDELKQK